MRTRIIIVRTPNIIYIFIINIYFCETVCVRKSYVAKINKMYKTKNKNKIKILKLK